jgi:sugar-specific transcriptional regulator TrmB
MLSFEEILDVAGMPRMEAYKILSALLRRGFIDVR